MNVFKKIINSSKAIDLIGLWSVGIICFLYSVFWSNFAEINIALPLLDFPIFIGEILLFWCVILLFLKWKANGLKLNYKFYFLLLYVLWVLIRASYGYFQWGPLALRNAALFYYTFFIFIGYHFYQKEYFSRKMVYALFIILFMAKIIRGPYFIYYFLPPYILLCAILILKMQKKKSQIFASLCLAYLIFASSFPYNTFFEGSRSFIIANFVTASFFALIGIFGISNVSKAGKTLIFTLLSLALIFVFLKFTPSHKVKSIMAPHHIIEELREYDQLIQQNKKTYVPKHIAPRIYNLNDGYVRQKDFGERIRISLAVRERVFGIAELIKKDLSGSGNALKLSENDISELEDKYWALFLKEKDLIQNEIFSSERMENKNMKIFYDEFQDAVRVTVASLVDQDANHYVRNIQTEYGNILFRLLIWRDMVEEIINEKAWFGISFGKPQRSISIENSGFADGEWGRDGWIAPHNAFLHFIYRAGMFGFLMVLGIITTLFVMIREFIGRKSLVGLLLVSILVYWLVLSSFLVVLELPYQAIPFWTLFGMIFAYFFKSHHDQKNESGVNWQQGGVA